MNKIITKQQDINSLADIVIYREQLKTRYIDRQKRLKHDVVDALEALPSRLLKPKEPNLKLNADGTIKLPRLELLVDKGVDLSVKLVMRKSNFLARWLVGTFLKKSLKEVLFKEKKNQNNFIPLPIAMKKEVINSPAANVAAVSRKKEKISFKGIWGVLKDAFTGFGDHKVTKISGSLAYYTVFSMAPLLVVVIALCGIFLKRDAAEGQIFAQLSGFVGTDTAAQLQEMIKKAAIGDKGIIATIIGLVTLLVGATTVFADIQDSINTIWGIKPKPKRGWLKMLQNRFLSFSVIISLGFLLLVSLGVSALLDGFSERLQAQFEDISVVFFYILNTVITFAVVSAIFGVIFKVLPDAMIRWRDVIYGAMVTALLFMIGKFAISFYIGASDIGSTYGAAGSMVILLLWTYYSSIILYFGAEFTKAYAVKYGSEIHPNHYAVTTKQVEVEEGGSSVQEIEKSK